MIVVDTNVIAYLYLPGPFTAGARALYQRDGEWAAPLLWRSELRNVLATQARSGYLDIHDILEIQAEAESVLQDREYLVASADVLRLASDSGCSAYDCEFVSLAEYLDVPLVTADRKLAARFKERARLLTGE